jgi:hypothetical protein
MFDLNKLITRDDKARFGTQGQTQKQIEEEIEMRRHLEKKLNPHSGNMVDLGQRVEREMNNMNYTAKTLDALAGGDDKIFVILDDRDDVWRVGGQPSENLH